MSLMQFRLAVAACVCFGAAIGMSLGVYQEATRTFSESAVLAEKSK